MFAKSVVIAGGFVCLVFGSALAGDTPAGCVAGATLETVKQCDASIAAVAARKNEVFLLSRKSPSTEQLLVLRQGEAYSTASVLLRDRPGRTLVSVHPAKDAIYVLAREGGDAELLRIPVRMSGGREVGFSQRYAHHCRNCRSFPMQKQIRVSELRLPGHGEVSDALASPTKAGISITMNGASEMVLSYDPSSGRFIEVN
jgi:hypothetical protein